DEHVVDPLVEAGQQHVRAARGEALVRIEEGADPRRGDPVDRTQVHDDECEALVVQLPDDGRELVGLVVAHEPDLGPDHRETVAHPHRGVLRALLVHDTLLWAHAGPGRTRASLGYPHGWLPRAAAQGLTHGVPSE